MIVLSVDVDEYAGWNRLKTCRKRLKIKIKRIIL